MLLGLSALPGVPTGAATGCWVVALIGLGEMGETGSRRFTRAGPGKNDSTSSDSPLV
jgi:hypothetical protein